MKNYSIFEIKISSKSLKIFKYLACIEHFRIKLEKKLKNILAISNSLKEQLNVNNERLRIIGDSFLLITSKMSNLLLN